MTLVQRYLGGLKGRTAWITGGKRIGHPVALALAEQGVGLVLSYRRSKAQAEEAAHEAGGLRGGEVALGDGGELGAAADEVERVQLEFSRIDILVNMASVYQPVLIDEAGEREWRDNIGAHILGTFWPSQLIAPLMPRGGHIVNVSSIAGALGIGHE